MQHHRIKRKAIGGVGTARGVTSRDTVSTTVQCRGTGLGDKSNHETGMSKFGRFVVCGSRERTKSCRTNEDAQETADAAGKHEIVCRVQPTKLESTQLGAYERLWYCHTRAPRCVRTNKTSPSQGMINSPFGRMAFCCENTANGQLGTTLCEMMDHEQPDLRSKQWYVCPDCW